MRIKEEIRNYIKKDVPSVTLDASLREVAEKMAEYNVSAILVKENKEIVGIVTDTDVLGNIAADRGLAKVKASEFMTSCEFAAQKATTNPCLQLCESDTIEDAMRVMATAGIHHLLVWGASGEAVGVISSRDLLKAALRK